ncbi:MAG: lysophospholipid acyltransferase family protein [Polyangiales bacterium]
MKLPDPLATAYGATLAPMRLAQMLAATGVGATLFLSEERWAEFTYERRRSYVTWWCATMLSCLGVEVVDDPANPKVHPVPEGGRMVVSNHRSMLDILVLLARFGGHMLSRDDLGRWPVIGWLARFSETLYIDRSSPTSGAASIREMSDRLAERHTVTVFAEGTTYPDDEVRPFQPGAFVAITRSGGEILPVGLAYEGDHAIFFQEPFSAHARKVLLRPKTRVAVSVGHAIPVGRRTSKALGAVSHERVQGLVRRARSIL